MPCFFKHSSSEVRLVVEPLLEADDAEVEVVLVELVLLLPQAAITRHAVIAADTSNIRIARRRTLVVGLTGGSFRCSGGNSTRAGGAAGAGAAAGGPHAGVTDGGRGDGSVGALHALDDDRVARVQ
jgi:hypothetical protein